jgi:adenylate cyclase
VVEAHVERRLAAILVADVVGYSRLMGMDEAGTRAKFNTQLDKVIRPAIEEHRGRLVNVVGDNFLVEFKSVTDAVECASAIQDGVTARQKSDPADHKMLFRIGIHLGDVIAEDNGIHGDGVNIAARLEQLAEPGGICLSEVVHASVRNKLSLHFVDRGEQSLKNIADPVQVFHVAPSAEATIGSAPSRASFRRPAVAVLPFENLSGDPDQEYFADGLSEDLITALSLFHSFPVIARNSTFAYKGQSPDIRKVGDELGARYVMEGSVRKAGNRMRVTCQLINAETGHHIWAEHYDRELVDVFELQDEISQRVAGIIEPTIERSERKQVFEKSPNDLALWEYSVRGNALFFEVTKEANDEARALFNRAIALDPRYARAHVGLAYSYARELRFFMSADQAECQRLLIETARRAVSLDDSDSQAHAILSLGYTMTQQPEAAVSEGQKAIQLNPNDATAHNNFGVALSLCANRYEEGIPEFERALQLSPSDINSPLYLVQLGISHLCAGRPEKAEEYSREVIFRKHDFLEGYLALASALGYQGRTDEARAAFENYGDIADSYIEQHVVFSPKVKEHLREGWRRANLFN